MKDNPERGHGQERPGGRTEAVRLAVAQCVLDLLKDGCTHFSMGEVAERAGIHRSTLYRRWQTQDELIREALTLHASKIRIPDTGDWPTDLALLVQNLAEFVVDPIELAIVRSMLNAGGGELSRQIATYWIPMMEKQTAPIRRAQMRGDISATLDPQMMLSLIMSPLLMRALVNVEPISTNYCAQLTEMVLRLARP